MVPLRKDTRYMPCFLHLPITEVTHTVELDDELSNAFDAARHIDLYGDDLGASARDLVMDWVGTKVSW